ncbi:transient receptor potential cation channel subfamily A member 1-like [Prunus avium]|uniref:Transient receptor potential cation channel subfamily A member 1-like n=1 Tax=Prunus avium TaxID=42229 RepID=A0A6P5SH01_PRUAV|nr:transient receptor potential cation channel subfamily A member 1-like [Prunus avium]XP_021815294.1 transient receptor potential cation channel subfamily A member 1-like [Prunus avium]
MEPHHRTQDFEEINDDADNLRLYQQLYSYATHGNTNRFNDTIANELHDPNARVQLLSRRSPQNNTFVHIAVSSGHVELAAKILQQHKPLLLEKNFEGDTALHIAAKAGDIDTTTNTLLREARGTTNVENNGDVLTLLRMKNNEENTALHEALIRGHQLVAKCLIEADPAVSLYTNKEQKSPLYLAAEQGLVGIVKLIKEKVVEKNTKIQGKSPLFAAILGRQKKEILKIISNMEANNLNSKDEKGRTPLHCAASIGFLEGVRFLGRRLVDSHQKDHCGNFPIHCASSKGHVNIVKELLRYCPDSMELRNSSDQNILHVAARCGEDNLVKYFLKKVEFQMLINQKDNRGNTPLHLAKMYHHPKVVDLFILDRRINLKVLNDRGMTALGISESTLETSASYHEVIPAVKEPNGVIQLYSSEKNARGSSSLPELDQILVEPGMETKRTTAAAVQIQHTAVATAWWLINRLVNCLEYPKTWLEETRSMLMIVATMISTTTFQAAVNPPGGVWQDNNTNSSAGGTTYCTQNNICFAGTSVAGSAFPKEFLAFVTFNTVSFLASLCVNLLLVGGFPLRNRVIMWLLSMAMCLTLTSMALTFLLANLLVVPNTDILVSQGVISRKSAVWAWIALLLTIASIHTIRLIIWLSRKLWGRFKHKIPKSLRNVVDSLVDSSRARHRTNKF